MLCWNMDSLCMLLTTIKLGARELLYAGLLRVKL
ncbi:hypothetical protein ES705_37347 [subsurface metagenome]